MKSAIDLKSVRARKARIARKIKKTGQPLIIIFILLTAFAAAVMFSMHHQRLGYLFLGLLSLGIILGLWYKRDLQLLPANKKDGLNGHLSADVLGNIGANKKIDTLVLWQSLNMHWQANFIMNRFLLSRSVIETVLGQNEVDIATVLHKAQDLADGANLTLIEPGHIIAAILLSSPQINNMLLQLQLTSADIMSGVNWLNRLIKIFGHKKPRHQPLGRDWTQGFTPLLSRYGHNISQEVENSGNFFASLSLSNGVQSLSNTLIPKAASIALIGEPGIGKTSHMYALAQLLLSHQNKSLSDYKVISLAPTSIISSTTRPGDLEYVVISLLREAAHAGHIILFFDDAQLFFNSSPGSVDVTQILLPFMQNGTVRLVFALTGSEFQSLKASHSSFSSLLTPVVLAEPDLAHIMEVLEDTALNFEYHRGIMITYQALQEAYRLSGRYEQDLAYPGKAIKLLEQSLQYASQGLVLATSIQKAVEQTKGVKVSAAEPIEANELLNLEDKIHSRMIDQKRAVEVVSGALRRKRAGVSDPNRPIGSFLFLGLTGVGKTELAKSLSAIYFNSEDSMIRIDMSEYQQPSDIDRLLDSGPNESHSFISIVRQQPFCVVLLDEIEKAHPNVLNLLLQLLDDGRLTDSNGRVVSFKDTIIIATSNAGAQTIRKKVEEGQDLESFEAEFIDELISSNLFKPELLNRFDEIVLFKPLSKDELIQVVTVMMGGINSTLAPKNISVEITKNAAAKIVSAGYDARLEAANAPSLAKGC